MALPCTITGLSLPWKRAAAKPCSLTPPPTKVAGLTPEKLSQLFDEHEEVCRHHSLTSHIHTPSFNDSYPITPFLKNSCRHSHRAPPLPPARRAGSNRLFQVLDLCWRSPESGDVWYQSGQWKRTTPPPSEGWWEVALESECSSFSLLLSSLELIDTKVYEP